MSLTAYPVAKDAHEALALLKQGQAKRAAREKEAEAAADARVAFVTQSVGPLYEEEAEALNIYAGLVEDHRPGHIFLPPVEARFCKLTCRMKDVPVRRSKSAQPVFADGERWAKASAPLETVWQLSISYWKVLDGAPASRPGPAGNAKDLRKRAKRGQLTPEEMLSLMDSPLISPRPQKALDFGLFDFIPPDNPGIVIADE
ncbi:hypothetical protein ABAC460_22130 [Asticcacaulis sp. AC460]|uniref:hypothetical protein n=1 Tax=Asticcacaulis sp. AC460 TaxID=1282360 RepID=UPI0003C3CDDD|nr:hypothetical protein [Asticcacaulis sp. AC460]ESQ86751.1 hypothetical protein ABAC460_22130 [Asticcacaulis sp. AC460]